MGENAGAAGREAESRAPADALTSAAAPVPGNRIEADFQWGPDSAPPDGLDWDMWNGPAPERKYNPAIHSQWRQLWDYGGGQMAYQGIHQLDLARWLCGVDYPSGVYCAGGRFHTQGGAETPDTQSAVFEFPNLLMTYFQRTYRRPWVLEEDL